MRHNLVILRCGRLSLHQHWLLGAIPRTWDLVLCPYEDIPPEPAAEYSGDQIAGQKWTGLHQFLTTWLGWRDYDYIWLPDDDLLTDCATINSLFELSTNFNAQISAPALSVDSYYSHFITMKNSSFFARAVTLIEIMMPCLRHDVLEMLMPTMAGWKSGYGFGLDYVWAYKLRYRGLIIFDTISVRHTRPAGGAHRPELVAEGNREMHEMTIAAGIYPQHKTLGAYSDNGTFRLADKQGFLLDLLNGYRYLIEATPNLLPLIIENQDKHIPFLDAQRRDLTLGNSVTRSQSGTPDAWWQLDLDTPYKITEIIVSSDLNGTVGGLPLAVYSSMDAEEWVIQGVKLDNMVFGGVEDAPYPFTFDPGFIARHIRITLIGVADAALDIVEVFGEVAHPS